MAPTRPFDHPLRRGSRPLDDARRTMSVVLAGCLLVLTGCAVPGLGGGEADPAPPTAHSSPAPSQDPAEQPDFSSFYGQRPTWRDCDEGFECTDVRVPIDWSNPAGETITLAVVRRKASGQRIGSLLINPGGPGVSGVEFVRQGASRFGAPLRSSFDLVGWDPRGVGGSAQVECLPNDEVEKYATIDGTPDTPAERAALIESNEEFAAGCQLRTGRLLAHVDTLSTVRDMDVLRAVLGDGTLSYFGASYGTFLGAWYAQTFPWRVGRLVLDGAVDPSLDAKEYVDGQTRGFAQAIEAYLQDCLNQQRCPLRGSVEDAKNQLGDLIERSDTRPLPTSTDRELPQSLLVTGIIQGMYTQLLWPRLTEALTQAMQGDGTGMLALADLYLERDDKGNYGDWLQSYSPIYCLDHPETRTTEQVFADAAELGKRYPPLGEAMGMALGCVDWPVEPVITPQRITAEGAGPILVVGTTGDPATPYEWSQSLADQLSSGRLITREGFGHTGYGESDCIDDAVEGYLLRGALPSDGTVCS